ncbi:MAG: complex I subunit 4 family protein [Nocardioidaceae bacterium]
MNPLTLTIVAPAAASLLLAVVHWRRPDRGLADGPAAAGLGVAVSLLCLVLVWLTWRARPPASLYAGQVDRIWITPLGVHWHLGMDGVSLAFAVMTVLLSAACCGLLVRHAPEGTGSTATLTSLVLLIEAAALGVFLSLDLVLFFLFFELALVPMWFVISGWGDPHDPVGRTRAATRFLMFTVGGSALMFVGFITISQAAGSLQIPALALRAQALTGPTALLGGIAIALGLAVKTPVWPLHTWLPPAHTSAPTVGSVLLAGVFLKLGTYGFIRILVPILPVPTARMAPYLAAFAVTGIIYASLACLRQRDLKSLVAWSSVGHMGFVILGLSTLTQAGLVAAVFASIAHGLVTGLLFVLAGSMKDRYGSADYTAIGRGLLGRTPWLGAAFMFACLASLGLPGLAGFWGEMLALRGSYQGGPALRGGLTQPLLLVALVGVVLTAAYFLVAVRQVLHGVPPHGGAPGELDTDLDRGESTIVLALVVGILWLGIVPGVMTGWINQALPWILGGVR